MDSAYNLTLETEPAADDVRFLGERLDEYNRSRVGEMDCRQFAVFLRDDAQHIVGGLVGMTYWGWLDLGALWVSEHLRGHGYGERLLEAGEAEAVRRGCRAIHLTTADYQALDFYLKRGYAVVGEIRDLPPGHTQYHLTKTLQQKGDDEPSGKGSE